jgi:hypothetical protein
MCIYIYMNIYIYMYIYIFIYIYIYIYITFVNQVEGDKSPLYNENKRSNDSENFRLRLNKMVPIEGIIIKGIKLFQNINKNIKEFSNINQDLFVEVLLELGIELSSEELIFIAYR